MMTVTGIPTTTNSTTLAGWASNTMMTVTGIPTTTNSTTLADWAFNNSQNFTITRKDGKTVLSITATGQILPGEGISRDSATREFIEYLKFYFANLGMDTLRMDHLEKLMPDYRQSVDRAIEDAAKKDDL